MGLYGLIWGPCGLKIGYTWPNMNFLVVLVDREEAPVVLGLFDLIMKYEYTRYINRENQFQGPGGGFGGSKSCLRTPK